MSSKFAARLSPLLLALSIALMLATVYPKESPTYNFQNLSRFSENVHFLSAEQINNRTLTLAAEIGDSSK